jgi:type II secretory pathway component PulC
MKLLFQVNLTFLSDIVRSATDKVTFVVLKNRGQDANTSTDEFSLPSLPYYNVNDMVNPDGSKTVTREVKNNDGSQTVILEHFDPSGRKLRQLSRRRWVTFEGSTRDASIVSLTFNGELSILINKTSQSQIVGLGLIVNLTHRGRKALVVSQVSPSGIFARTPLSVGDTIISINGVDFSEKPNINGAAALLSKTEGNVTVRALKSKNWIERRKRRLPQSRHLEESFTIPAPKSRSFEFDNVSYGGSSLGYQSAKKLTLKDFSASELHGIALKCEPTQWGALLVATIVAPSSRFTAAGLQDGDIILSVNGVDFREEPDANKAMSLIHSADADADTEIEYQRLDNSVQEERETPIIKAKHSFKPDGTKCIRTETRNPDGSILVNLKEIGPGNAVDVAIKESPASLVRASDMSEISGWDGLTLHNYMHDEQSLALEDASVPTSAESLSIVTNPLEPVTITVDKKSKSQNVGISLVASEGVLYVKKISAGGLLVGKPILPGDTVIAINGRDFRSNPSVKEASSTILNSFKTLSLKILKTSLTGGGRGKELVTPKIRGVSRFCCSKPMDHSDKSATRKIVLGSSKRSEYKSLIL